MTEPSSRAIAPGKWVLGGMLLIALVILAFEWRWHHGAHKLEFKACLHDTRGLPPGAPVEFDGARIGYVQRISTGPLNCPAQAEIYLNSLQDILIPSDSHAVIGKSSEDEPALIIQPGQSRVPVGVGGTLNLQP